MPRRRLSGCLNIFLNGRMVGKLTRQASGAVDFQYAQEWLDWEHTMAISQSLPLREDRYIGAPVQAVFDNLLPDNPDIRRTVAERLNAPGTDAFSLLSALGRDCVGALQFLPEDMAPSPVGAIHGHPTSDDEIAAIVENLTTAPLGMDRDRDFRISLAGAQEKTALLYHDDQWMVPDGSTATTHILKPQIGLLSNGIDMTQSVENEYFCMTFTKAMGIPTASVSMQCFGHTRALIVKRFDRLLTEDGRLLRLPQEDCCQALSVPWTHKYESDGGPGVVSILKLLASSDDVTADRKQFLKAQIVFWLLGATDGHAKNFSLMLSFGGGFRLAPLYDVLSVQPIVDAGQIRRNEMKMAMSFGMKPHYRLSDITGRHFLQSAVKAGVSADLARDAIGDVVAECEVALGQTVSAMPAGFPEGIAGPIAAGVRTRLRALCANFIKDLFYFG